MAQQTKTTLEPFYDQFYQDILRSFPGLDPMLAMKIVKLNKTLLYRPPHVHLYVKYKEGVNFQEKVDYVRDHYQPVQAAVSRWGDGVIMSGLMDTKLVERICSDKDIVEITGNTHSAMY